MLDRLRRAGYVRVVRALGAGGSRDPLYEIADDYLAYWFAVLRDDADLIDGGQERAVRQRTWGRWQTHLARVFEGAARDHAQRLVAAGTLPADTIIGRWWKDETVEIDVLGLTDDRPTLVAHLPPPGPAGLTYAFWSRDRSDGPLATHPQVRVFTPADIIGTG
jgi:AAA+ ATPase superfamily predicted ATPase